MQNRDLLIQTQIPYHVIISQNDFLDFVRYLDYPLSTRFVLVSDDKVAPLYLDDLKKALQAAGYSVLEWIMPHGEENKSQETYFALLDFLAKETITRSDVLIAKKSKSICVGLILSGYRRPCYLWWILL